MIICPNWVRTTDKQAPSGVLFIWNFMSRDSRIHTVLECMTFFSLGPPGLGSDVKRSRQDPGGRGGGKLPEPRRPPPCHGTPPTPPQFDEIIYVNVYGFDPRKGQPERREKPSCLAQSGWAGGPQRTAAQREGETCSLHIRKGMELFSPGLNQPSPPACLKRCWRKRTSLRGGREARGAKGE